MVLSVEHYLAIGGTIIVPLLIAIIYKKRSKKSNHSCSFSDMKNLGDNEIIKNIQREINEMKSEITAYRLDSDQLNTRLSRMEGMLSIIKDRLD